VKTLAPSGFAALVVTTAFAGAVLADPPINRTEVHDEKAKEVAVFVTGSLIPQRVKVRQVGTATVSPVRIIDRREIDETGRHTTTGVVINDPSVRVIGH
jgi:hypothetical protein